MGDDIAILTKTIQGHVVSHENDSKFAERNDAANHVLTDYYRCPANVAQFLPARRSLDQPGYFRLGEDTICYGRLPEGVAASPVSELNDALDNVRLEAAGIWIPFDPGEIIENLHRERYAAHFREEGRVLNDILRKAYYFVRPLLGVSARRRVQRMGLRGWNNITFPSWPVDTTVERIHQKLLAFAMRDQGLKKIPFIWFWPEGFRSCAIMTHDVEGSCGRDFCPKLMDLDESYGFYSAFQVVPENRYPVPKSFLDGIVRRGFEVNVHDLKHDGRLYANYAEFLRRAKRINHYVREFGAQGFRSGILYRNADWFTAFEFSYDMSLPNVAHLDPQRGGCCTVMPYFIGKIVELPLTATQDYALFHILGDYSLDLWKEQIALILANHGLINFLVHPDYIIEPRALGCYKALLGHLAQLKEEGSIWTALPRDVANWWMERSQMELVFEEGQWQVQGAGKERARVAYAELIGDEMAYSFAG
ncbi:MAG: hypothetical protein ACRD2P_00170 [Terriglobia bacterium]